MRLHLRCEKGKAGRSPRALPISLDAVSSQHVEHGSYVGAGIAPTLHRTEVVADMVLNRGDGAAEAGDIPLGKRRQCLHDDNAAQMRCKGGRKFRQRREGFSLFLAMRTLSGWVEDEQNAPFLGERQPADGWSRRAIFRPASVERKTPSQKQTCSKAGPRRSVEADDVRRGVGIETVQASEGGGHPKRELRAGTEPGMRGNRLGDRDFVAGRNGQGTRQYVEITKCALRLRPRGDVGCATAELKLCGRFVERQADPAEAPAKPAMKIEKPQVQARSHDNGNGILHEDQLRVSRPGGMMFSAEFLRFEGCRGCESIWQRRGRRSTMSEPKAERIYTDAEVEERLKAELPRWRLENGWIRRKYKTASWKGTLMVINTVGHLAEAAWHHPDIAASYAWVEVKLQNHAAKGITDKDFQLAKKIEDVVQWQPAKDGGALEGTPADDMRFAYIKYDR